MVTILIASFILVIMLLVKFNLNTLINMFTDYTNVTGMIEKNLGKGKNIVKFYKTPWVLTTIKAYSTNALIPVGTTVTLEKESMFSYRIYCWISMDPEYVGNKTDFENSIHYFNEVKA